MLCNWILYILAWFMVAHWKFLLHWFCHMLFAWDKIDGGVAICKNFKFLSNFLWPCPVCDETQISRMQMACILLKIIQNQITIPIRTVFGIVNALYFENRNFFPFAGKVEIVPAFGFARNGLGFPPFNFDVMFCWHQDVELHRVEETVWFPYVPT